MKTRPVLERTTIVATPLWARAAVWLALPLVGAGLLLGLDRVADRVVQLPWAPLRGPFRLIQQVPEPQATIGALALGAVAGLVLAYFVDQESLTVRLSGTEMALTRPGATTTMPLAEVAVVFREKDRLVVLGRTGRELAREPCHLAPARLERALRDRGVVWVARDPYADTYRRWIPGSPEVPAAANAVFAARQAAIRGGDGRDVAELRAELARLGFVVRDEHKRQYWRRTDG
jgi:hypothetical protein